MEMGNLNVHCAYQELKEAIKGGESEVKELKKRDSRCLHKVVDKFWFDLMHKSWET
jgi:uncharacterized FlgJ-related protein